MEIPHIRPLPPEVIGQIAAGEVVERPSAAIKELVENSIDAGATSITVDIKEGGLTAFRVTDNGCGIRPEDIKMAFARHATSKIRTADDLYGVQSLGFRGEALASIAAVAQVTCLTRARGQENGISARNEGGTLLEIKDAACPEGTTFTVKSLFFNAPVRRKFLKKPAAETAAVSDLMARLILSHPAVSFRFMADGKLVYFSAGDGKIESAIMSVYGMNTLKLLTKVDGNMNGVLVSGYIGVGDAGRGNRSHEHFYINGRAMKSALLSAAVESACRQRITIGRFPMCVLHLNMPYEATDVNVHPNKWEIRFQDERGVRQAVETLCFEALEQANLSPVIPAFYQNEAAAPTPPVVYARLPEPPAAPAPVTPPPLSAFGLEEAAAPKFTPRDVVLPKKQAPAAPMVLRDGSANLLPPLPPIPAPKSAREKAAAPQTQQLQATALQTQAETAALRVIGVAFDTYILVEYGETLILCDQHAAHERLLYERFMRETAAAPASQALLIPQIIPLSRADYAAYTENEKALRQAGFDLSPLGEDALQLRGVPIILGQPQAEKCLREVLDSLVHNPSVLIADRTTRVIQMACKHAVKGGEKLPQESVLALIRDIMEQKVTPTCPHGRPLMVQLTHTELDKRFRRIQNDHA